MNISGFLFTLFLVLLAAFVLVNWGVFVEPTELSFIVTDVQAPLGLIMLVVCAALGAVFVAYIALQQANMIIMSRRHAKELAAERAVAEQAEASRVAELRTAMTEQMKALDERIGKMQEDFGTRSDAFEEKLNNQLTDAANSLVAYIAEVEDKLDRVLGNYGR